MKLSQLSRHHHFREPLIDPDDHIALLEATVVRLLIESDVPDSDRDSSIAWEIKHQAGVTQMARLLAARRGLDADIAAAGALLHDIYVIVTGSYDNHAVRGGPIAEMMLGDVGLSDPIAREKILLMVTHHSAKDVYEEDPYTELGKDVDTLDCFLYPMALSEYLLVKPWRQVREYLQRAQKIWSELLLPIPPEFRLLDDYLDQTWFQRPIPATGDEIAALELQCERGSLPFPMLIERESGHNTVSTTPAGAPWLSSFLSSQSPPSVIIGASGHRTVLWPHLRRSQSLPEWMESDLEGLR